MFRNFLRAENSVLATSSGHVAKRKCGLRRKIVKVIWFEVGSMAFICQGLK